MENRAWGRNYLFGQCPDSPKRRGEQPRPPTECVARRSPGMEFPIAFNKKPLKGEIIIL